MGEARHDHPWWGCEECRQKAQDRLDANLRRDIIRQGIPEHDADLLIAQAREEGRKLREQHSRRALAPTQPGAPRTETANETEETL